MDLFAFRCCDTQQLQALREGLCAALNEEAAILVTSGVFSEQFGFLNDAGFVRIEVDQLPLAEIPWDVANRLSTALQGVSSAKRLSIERGVTISRFANLGFMPWVLSVTRDAFLAVDRLAAMAPTNRTTDGVEIEVASPQLPSNTGRYRSLTCTDSQPLRFARKL